MVETGRLFQLAVCRARPLEDVLVYDGQHHEQHDEHGEVGGAQPDEREHGDGRHGHALCERHEGREELFYDAPARGGECPDRAAYRSERETARNAHEGEPHARPKRGLGHHLDEAREHGDGSR